MNPINLGGGTVLFENSIEVPQESLISYLEKEKDRITLKDILKHTVLTHTQNNNNIEILQEKPLTQDEKDLQLLQK